MIEMTKVRIYFAIKSNVGISSYVLKETKYISPLQLSSKNINKYRPECAKQH